ncbi:hypothetical protein C8A03DRAFT_11672 [Achaetomium macrosporum]|uniref:Required for respiratory growth protein 9, mitochondrial n=1 Tax=Achaetomium macrosporum TaxID=79813 RepID=A0AAN7HEG7_9PEZI|nr:hypothetical protein C8A03DRAFT_11672 [Achaetomium macrosporum]
MDCSCRTAALRIFVKSIAQIQVPLRTATPRLVQYQAQVLLGQPNLLYNQTAISVFANASRGLHTSCVRSSSAAASQAVEGEPRRAEKHEDATESETAPRSSEPASDRSGDTESRDPHTDATSSGVRKEKAAEAEPKKLSRKAKRELKDQRRSQRKPEDDDDDYRPNKREPWMIQKEALKKKFPGGWSPRKKLSPDALIGIRMLHKQFPEEYTTEVLAKKFEVSPEAIRRILKSKWTPDPEEELKRQERWFNRGKKVWAHWAALGKKPPRKWRAEGIVRDPYWNRPRGPNHKDPVARAEAQRRLAKGLAG